MKELDTKGVKRSPAPILATPANMAKYGGPGVFSYDRYSRERFSADAGDYFWQRPDQPLTGKFGKPLILARCVSFVLGVSDDVR